MGGSTVNPMRREWRPLYPKKPERPRGPRFNYVAFILVAALVAILASALGRLHRELLAWWLG